MTDEVDVTIVGLGPGGEVAAYALLDAGKRVAVVERELVGGECAYWACIPTKAALRPLEVRAAADPRLGLTHPMVDVEAWAAHRDQVARNRDDSCQRQDYHDRGALLLTGEAELLGDGVVRVGEREVHAADVIVATGSAAVRPPLDGLELVDAWTNREATEFHELPPSVLVLGGGPAGVELGQMFARLGSHVRVLQGGDQLLRGEHPDAAALVQRALEADGVEVVCGARGTAVRPTHRGGGRGGRGVAVDTAAGTFEADQLVLATGRRPRSPAGIEATGARLTERGAIEVDDRCQAAPGVWAVGDVTAIAPFTHAAKYQARVVVANLLGRPTTARYDGIPRCTFTDPELAAVGTSRTASGDAERAAEVDVVRVDLAAALARPWTYAADPWGSAQLEVDRASGTVTSAWAVAPMAAEWIHAAALAVRTAMPAEAFLDLVPQFPTFSEAWLAIANDRRAARS